MDNSLKVQLDVKNNVQDLQNYMLDLTNWEEEMKKKELKLNDGKPQEYNIPPPRNKIKRSKPENGKSYSNKPKKISAYDYTAWDKFDVDKACAEIDDEECDEKELETEPEGEEEEDDEEKEETENDKDKQFSLVDEAFYEKELGNQFVKKEQWNEAAKCYTNAIVLDSKNAIYYANRSLCFLKMKKFKSAEVDATVAIQLDKDYVKAYQRRAFSRLALGQVAEAKSDYEEILRIEPKNALAMMEIDKINGKLNKKSNISKTVKEKPTFNHKDLFKNEKIPKTSKAEELSKVKPVTTKKVPEVKKKESQNKSELRGEVSSTRTVPEKEERVETKEEKIEMGDGDKEIISQSNNIKVFEPLPEWCSIINPVHLPPHKRSKKPLTKINIVEVDTDDPVKLEKEILISPSDTEVVTEKTITEKKNEEEYLNKKSLSFDVPKTSIEFQNCWKVIKKNPKEAYSYLKKIPYLKLPQIFENSLESDFFSELVTFLASDEIEKDPEFIYCFLYGLSNVKRFTSLVLFMSGNDRKCVNKCLDGLEGFVSEEDLTDLFDRYEL